MTMRLSCLPATLLLLAAALHADEPFFTNGFEKTVKNRVEQFHGVYAVCTDGAPEGKICISQPNRGDRIEARYQPPFIPVKGDQTYRLTVKSRNTMPTGLIRFGIVGSSTLDEKGHIWHSPRFKVIPCNSDAWRDYSLVFKTPASAKGLTLVFRIDGSPAKEGTAYWDDVRLEAFTPPVQPIDLEPYEGMVTFTDMPTMLSCKPEEGKKVNTWKTLDLAALPLAVNTHQLPTDSTVSYTVARAQKTCLADSRTVSGDARIVFTPDLSKLERGDYLLTVKAESQGKVLATATRDLRRIRAAELEPPPMQPVKSYRQLPGTNVFGINGSYYPIVLVCAFPQRGYACIGDIPDVENYLAIARKQTGANKLGAYNYGKRPVWPDKPMDCKSKDDVADYFAQFYTRQLDLYWKLGFYASVSLHIGKGDRVDNDLSRALAPKIASHPGFLYYSYDEPEVHKDSHQAIISHYDVLHKADPNHAIDINLCQHWRFKDYGPGTDTASFDYYPFHGTGLEEWERYILAMKAAIPGKPLVAYIQAFNFKGESVPTPDEITTQMRLGIIHGTRLLAIYSWSENGTTPCLVNNLELQSHVKGLVAEYYSLMDFIVPAKEVELKAACGNGIRFSAYQKGDEVCLLVANLSSIEKQTFALPDFKGNAESFLDSAWTVPPDSLRKGLTLEPYASCALRLKK